MEILFHNVYKIINKLGIQHTSIGFFPYNYKNRVLACFQTRPAIYYLPIRSELNRPSWMKDVILRFFVVELFIKPFLFQNKIESLLAY